MPDRRVDDPFVRDHLARGRRSEPVLLGTLPVVLLLAGCAAGPELRPLPVPPGTLESEIREDTRPRTPTRLVFEWHLSEQGSRLEGRGVARIQPPYRARLDLFTDGGETAARAALVEGEIRTPPEVDERLIPPPQLLWASLGVFHPGAEAELISGEGVGSDGSRLRYRLDGDGEAWFHLRSNRLRSVELLDEGRVIQRVELEWDEDGAYPSQAVYRDLTAFRELRVAREATERVEDFSPDIWRLDE